jgi:hypothetical protein
MYENIEKDLKRIVDLVKLCPSNLQEKCFELLLNGLISESNIKKAPSAQTQDPPPGVIKEEIKMEEDLTEKQEEIKLSDLHVKARKLLEQGLTLGELNNVFYKENNEIKPLFDDLKSSKVSESQIKIALIEAFKNGYNKGEFSFNTDTVKQQCDVYKCYDQPNFASHFKKQENLFNEQYVRSSVMSLSSEGKKELVKVLKDLAS